jgi:hypothetical protein
LPRWWPRATNAPRHCCKALADGEVQVSGKRVLIVKGEQA